MIMFNNLNTEMKCTVFAGSVFIIFFASSFFSVVKAEPIQSIEDPGNGPYEMVQPYRPDAGKIIGGPNLKLPSGGGDPHADGPSNLGAPDVAGPNENPPASIFGWWYPIANFFKNILECLGFQA